MKYAIVTGGTRGIGLAAARKLSESGYVVLATYAHSEEDASTARAALPAVRFVKCDVSSEREVCELIKSLPHIDVLVCNAGISLIKQVQDTEEGEYRRVMDVNAGGVFFCCKHAAGRMLERGGAIVTVSSVWGGRRELRERLCGVQRRRHRVYEVSREGACSFQYHGKLRQPRGHRYEDERLP